MLESVVPEVYTEYQSMTVSSHGLVNTTKDSNIWVSGYLPSTYKFSFLDNKKRKMQGHGLILSRYTNVNMTLPP